MPWLTEEEFLQKYRCKRASFWLVVGLIKDHPVFNPSDPRGRKQSPVSHQLLVFLFYIGTSGSGANNPHARNVFGIGRGTVDLYKTRCLTAIRSLRDQAIKWPNVDERKEIAQWIYVKYKIPNCIAVADGTLFPLAREPECVDAPDYHGRKLQVTVSVT